MSVNSEYDTVWMPQPGSQTLFLQSDKVFEVLLHGNRGGGKRLEVAEPVLTARGWVAAGDVTEDDMLVAPDGTYTDIVEIHRGSGRPFYRITTEGGATTVACADHLWSVYDDDNGHKYGWITRDTKWIKERVDNGRYIYLPLMSAPAPGPKWGGLDPYIAGLVLGDGSLTGANVVVYTVDEHAMSYLSAAGWQIYDYDSQNTTMMNAPKALSRQWRDLLGKVSRGDKRVPKCLLEADPETRLAVLQGLMDSDGSVEKGKGTSSSPGGQVSFAQGHIGLCEDVQYLVRSLGGKARIKLKKKRVTNRGGKLPEYEVNITHANKFNPFRMPRKAELVRKQKGIRDRIVSVEPVGLKEGVCFAVAHPSHLYVCKDFMVTHNTDALIMSFCKHVGKGYGQYWQGILFRQTYKQLQDVVKKTKKWIPRMFPGAQFNEGKMHWTFPEGEVLRLAHMRVPSDYDNYHGHEYPWIGFEELSTWSTDQCYTRMFSCCRSSGPLDMPRIIRSTTNPYGPGFTWVKRRFQLPQMNFKIWKAQETNPDTGRVTMSKPRLAIQSRLSENKILLASDPDYMNTIRTSARNESELRAWLFGSWDIVAGGMFSDVWDPSVHVTPPFQIPRNWRIDRSMDWGSAKPFSVGWYAESDGNPIRHPVTGKVYGDIPGDVFRIGEWYGSTGKPNEGLGLTGSEIGEGIRDREIDFPHQGNIHRKVRPGPADHNIFGDGTRGARAISIDQEMRRSGIRFEKALKGPGSRKAGWQVCRDHFSNALPIEGDGERGGPGLYIFDTCRYFLDLVPTLSRSDNDPDDIDTQVEDHIADELRYRLRRVRRAMMSTDF